jgi:hypothetical protein
MSEVAPVSHFDAQAHLAARAANPSFTMVEMGHDWLPVAEHQPTAFTGQRVYIGIEAWLRDPYGAKRSGLVEKTADIRASQNVFFMAQDLGGEVCRDSDETPSWYSGEYDTQTVLPDGIADEVFMSNVFCDPHIAHYGDRTERLLTEVARLTADGGKIVLRETITPQYVRLLSSPRNPLVRQLGLQVEARVAPNEEEAWGQLEEVYEADRSCAFLEPRLDSYYLLLQKQGQDSLQLQ